MLVIGGDILLEALVAVGRGGRSDAVVERAVVQPDVGDYRPRERPVARGRVSVSRSRYAPARPTTMLGEGCG